MTSLASQLKHLRVKAPFVGSTLGSDLSRPSVWREPGEAAKYDREAVYELGLSGLDELETINKSFVKYEQTLFSRESVELERSTQTSEVNSQLDDNIGDFLIELSPYMLLSAARKALEWLVYRYRVHEFNVDALISCALLYHDTALFVIIIKLVRLDDPTNRWHWLHNCAKSGVPLPRSVLINHCRKDPGFFSLMCGLVPSYIQVLGPESPHVRLPVAMFLITSLGVLERRADVTPRLVATLVPHLAQGLRARCADLRCAVYMVLAQLARGADLEAGLLRTLIDKLTKHMAGRQAREAVCCLVIVLQNQRGGQGLISKKSFRYISRLPGLTQLLCSLAASFNILPLVGSLLDALVPAAIVAGAGGVVTATEDSTDFGDGGPAYYDVLVGVLEGVELSGKMAVKTATAILSGLVERGARFCSQPEQCGAWSDLARPLLSVLDRRMPTALESAFSALQQNSAHLEALHSLACLTSTPIRFQLVPDLETNLLLGLAHAQATHRYLAVKHLQSVLTAGGNEAESLPQEFLKGMLVERLADDDSRVVSAVLDLDQRLVDLVGTERLGRALLCLIQRTQDRKAWGAVTRAALQLACSERVVTNGNVAVDLVPSLLVVVTKTPEEGAGVPGVMLGSAALRGAAVFCNLPASDLLALLQQVNSDPDKASRAIKLGCYTALLTNGLAESFAKLSADEYTSMVQRWTEIAADSARCRFLIVLVLTRLLAIGRGSGGQSKRLMIAEDLLRLVAMDCQSDEGGRAEDCDWSDSDAQVSPQTLAAWLRRLKKHGRLSAGCRLYCLSRVLATLKHCGGMADEAWLDREHPCVRVVIGLLQALVPHLEKKPWKNFLNRAEEELDRTLLYRVLCVVWCRQLLHPAEVTQTVDSGATADLSLTCFDIVQRLLATKVSAVSTVVCAEVVPCLLLALAAPLGGVSVRQGALVGLRALGRGADDQFLHRALVRGVVKRSEEICADHNYVAQAVAAVYKTVVADSTLSLVGLLACVTAPDTPEPVRAELIHCLRDVPHKLVLADLVRVGQDRLSHRPLTDLDLIVLQRIISRFDTGAASLLGNLEAAPTQFLLKALRMGEGAERSPQILAANQLGRELYHKLTSLPVQHALVTSLVDAYLAAVAPQQAGAVTACIKRLKLNCVHLCHELKVTEPPVKPSPGGRKRSSVTVAPIDMKRLTFVLEVAQSRRRFDDSVEMAGILFGVLSCLVAESLTEASAEQEGGEERDYCKQLALTSLHNICVGWATSPDLRPEEPEDHVNVGVLVDCIRSTASPHTQQLALSVVCAVAPLYPSYILSHVMTLFTFMGADMAQRDDTYSFQVIMRAIDTVIPAVILAHKSLKPAPGAPPPPTHRLQTLVDGVLRSFVAPRHTIPPHRALPLFHRLLDTLGVGSVAGGVVGGAGSVEGGLWRLHVMIVESAVGGARVGGEESGGGAEGEESTSASEKRQTVEQRDLDLAVNISGQFKVKVQLEAVVQTVRFLQDLLAEHDQGTKSTSDVESSEDTSTSDDDITPPATQLKRSAPGRCGAPSKKPKRDARGARGGGPALINLVALTPHQKRLMQYHVTRLVTAVLADRKLIAQVLAQTRDPAKEESTDADLIDVFQRLVDQTLSYMSCVNRVTGRLTGTATGKEATGREGTGRDVCEMEVELAEGSGRKREGGRGDGRLGGAGRSSVDKFWAGLLQKTYELLDKVHYLLPTSSFLSIVSALMSHSSASVRHKAMDLLNARLQGLDQSQLTPSETGSLVGLVDKLCRVAGGVEGAASDNRQMALYSAKLLCRLLGAQHHATFTPLFPVTVSILERGAGGGPQQACAALRCTALLCAAELCATLRAHAIAHLPTLVPAVIASLHDKPFLASGGEMALLSCLTAVQRIVASLPHFLSQYLVELLLCWSDLSSSDRMSSAEVASNTKRAMAADKLTTIGRLLSTSVCARVFVPALTRAFSQTLSINQRAVAALMSLLRQCVESATKEELSAQQASLVQLYCQALDIRNSALELGRAALLVTEDALIDAVIAHVVRLSENSFRPIFFKLFDWSCREDDAVYRNRKLTFFRLTDRLAGRLKGVFTLFVGHIVKAAIHMLDVCSQSCADTGAVCFPAEDEEGTLKACLMLDHILGCLHKCLMYDSSKTFVDTYATHIMQPIIDQLENFVGGDDAYRARVTACVVPCVGQLAVAARESSAWKNINHLVCLKTNHASAKVRFAALRAVEEMALKLGDAYEALLPDTMTYISELLEDDAEEVEEECKRVKGVLEDIIGDSLNKYF